MGSVSLEIAFGFYSANDQFQARFFNLEGNYTFLNRQPVYPKENQDFLTEIVIDLEKNVSFLLGFKKKFN